MFCVCLSSCCVCATWYAHWACSRIGVDIVLYIVSDVHSDNELLLLEAQQANSSEAEPSSPAPPPQDARNMQNQNQVHPDAHVRRSDVLPGMALKLLLVCVLCLRLTIVNATPGCDVCTCAMPGESTIYPDCRRTACCHAHYMCCYVSFSCSFWMCCHTRSTSA